jgi:hypothetical protein
VRIELRILFALALIDTSPTKPRVRKHWQAIASLSPHLSDTRMSVTLAQGRRRHDGYRNSVRNLITR